MHERLWLSLSRTGVSGKPQALRI